MMLILCHNVHQIVLILLTNILTGLHVSVHRHSLVHLSWFALVYNKFGTSVSLVFQKGLRMASHVCHGFGMPVQPDVYTHQRTQDATAPPYTGVGRTDPSFDGHISDGSAQTHAQQLPARAETSIDFSEVSYLDPTGVPDIWSPSQQLPVQGWILFYTRLCCQSCACRLFGNIGNLFSAIIYPSMVYKELALGSLRPAIMEKHDLHV